MTPLHLMALAVAAGVAAAAWPYIPKLARRTGMVASARAGWVNRLFALAADAEASGEAHVAEAARQLIDALVHPNSSQKRAR